LSNAASVSGLMLTTECVIAVERGNKHANQQQGASR